MTWKVFALGQVGGKFYVSEEQGGKVRHVIFRTLAKRNAYKGLRPVGERK